MATNPPIRPGQPFIDAWPTAQPTTQARERLNALREALTQAGGENSTLVPKTSVAIFTPERYVWINGAKSFPVPNGSSSKIIDAPDTFRNFLYLWNTSGAAIVTVNFGAPATATLGLRLGLNEQLMLDVGVPQDDIYVYGTAAGTISVMWGNVALPIV